MEVKLTNIKSNKIKEYIEFLKGKGYILTKREVSNNYDNEKMQRIIQYCYVIEIGTLNDLLMIHELLTKYFKTHHAMIFAEDPKEIHEFVIYDDIDVI